MRFVKESVIHAAPTRVFAFHERADALKLLTPPWEDSRILEPAQISAIGSRAIIEAKVLGFRMRWVAEHTVYDPPHAFEDIQVKGPFRSWRHRHVVEPHQDGARLRDEIDYTPPLGFLGRMVAPLLIEPRLRKLFEYRHQVTVEWCERSAED